MDRTHIARLSAGLLFLLFSWIAYTQNQGQQTPQLTISKVKDDLYNHVEKLRNRVSGLIHEGKSQDEVGKVLMAEYGWAPGSLNMQWSVPGMMRELK